MKNLSRHLPPKLQPFVSLLDTQPPKVQEAFQFLPATAMHEGGNPRFGKFALLNLAGGFPAKRTLLVTAISRCQKTSHQFGPRNTRKATEGTKGFRGLCFLHALHDHSPDGKKLA
jgi:hypothetical protein